MGELDKLLQVLTRDFAVLTALLFALLTIILMAPYLTFLWLGWFARKEDVLGNFTEKSAALYLQSFYPQRLVDGTANPRESMATLYSERYGRSHYVMPVLVLLCTSALLLWMCKASVDELHPRNWKAGELLSLPAVLAIIGGYTWVLFDSIDRCFRNDVRPRDLYWATFRLVIALPMALSITSLFLDVVAAPIAFLLGTFPTVTLFSIGRRLVAKNVQLTDAIIEPENELQFLPGINSPIAERLVSEGISSIQQLSTADPVKLTMRTGLEFSMVVGCIGDALLWVYLPSAESFGAARANGVCGAFDARTLLNDLESTDAEAKAMAQGVIAKITEKLVIPEASVKNILFNVAYDPNALFIYEVWSANQFQDAVRRGDADNEVVSNGIVDQCNRIFVGGDAQPVTELSPCQWGSGCVELMAQVRQGASKNGVWHLSIERQGAYEIALRRWPKEIDAPIAAAIAEAQGPDGVIPAGVALPITKARIKLGEFDQTAEVNTDAKSISFTAELPRGPVDLQTWFYDGGGQELCGAYFVYVQRL